ncbi:hypothetical protein LWT02_09310 [Enterobacter bugandensis]|uniref:hypothetical protein n=1 Tax=Enterobacter bugandensis TaxID=881260 RepID=UPI001E5676EB|nr:hypothetical protein [Enterobacter bugandensis]MCE1957033.1 hypothetical protein [Enterobacter bugandensis]
MDAEEMRDFLGLPQEIPGAVLLEFHKLGLAYSYVEARFLGGNANFGEARDYAESFVHNTDINVDRYFSFFKNRYVLAEDAHIRLQNLSNFKPNIIRRIHDSLGLEHPTKVDKVEAIFLVIIRLRNNALHGNKAGYLFDEEQAVLISQANDFLSEYLNAIPMNRII